LTHPHISIFVGRISIVGSILGEYNVNFTCQWIGFVGKIFTGNPWVFTIKYRVFRLNFSHHPMSISPGEATCSGFAIECLSVRLMARPVRTIAPGSVRAMLKRLI